MKLPTNQYTWVILLAMTIGLSRTAASPPNFIIIYTDDQTAGDYYGYEGAPAYTPVIDQLASTGLRFDLAVVSSSICSPSRYSVMTGRYASRSSGPNFTQLHPPGTLGRVANNVEIEIDRSNMARLLQEAGYRTGFVGKSHVIDHHLNQNTANWAASGLQTYEKGADPATNPTINARIKANHDRMAANMTAYGFDYVNGFYTANLRELFNDALNVHNQEWITAKALEFIEDQSVEEPFLLYFATTISHGPIRTSAPFTYTLDADPAMTGEGAVALAYPFMPSRAAIKNEALSNGASPATAHMTLIDYSVKALLQRLEVKGLRDNTVIVFMADHGLRNSAKSTAYDDGLRVPFFISWPEGIALPARHGGLVQNIDIVPTLLELADVPAPPDEAMDGISLKPILDGRNEPLREDVYTEIGYARAIRTETWKYIAVRYTEDIYARIEQGDTFNGRLIPGTNEYEQLERPYYIQNAGLSGAAADKNPNYFSPDQLYLPAEDPREHTNLASRYPEVIREMRQRLARTMLSIPDRPFREFTRHQPAITAPAQITGLSLQAGAMVSIVWGNPGQNVLGFTIEAADSGGVFHAIADDDSESRSIRLPRSAFPRGDFLNIRLVSYNVTGSAASLVATLDLSNPEAWRNASFGPTDPQLQDPVFSGWNADPDQDGRDNLWEYAFGRDPLVKDAGGELGLRWESSGDLRLQVRRAAHRKTGFRLFTTPDLKAWTNATSEAVPVREEAFLLEWKLEEPAYPVFLTVEPYLSD